MAKTALLKSTKILHYRQAHSEDFQNVDSLDQLPTLTTCLPEKKEKEKKEKTLEAAARHNTLVLRTKTILASMEHECTDKPDKLEG